MTEQGIADLEEKVHAVVAEVLDLDPSGVTADLRMEDVESWDSLRHMELVGALEQGFTCEFTFDEIVAMRTVRDMTRVLRGKQSSN